jgi:hypothetical protein
VESVKEDLSSGRLEEKTRPYLQNKQSKKGWRCAQDIEPWPNKHKTLSSNPNITPPPQKNQKCLSSEAGIISKCTIGGQCNRFRKERINQ